MTEIYDPVREILHRRISSECGSMESTLKKGEVQLECGRPVLTRRSLSLRRQSTTATQEKAASYFTLSLPYTSKSSVSSSCSDGTSPPPPYFSPQLQAEDWAGLLQQGTNLPDSLLLPTSVPRSEKRRPMSFHGTQLKEQSAIDVQNPSNSNFLVQKQLANMREELLRMRRRCAELSEVEARKKGLELRCLGLERVVEELMAAVELLKVQSQPAMQGILNTSAAEATSQSEPLMDIPKGLGIEMEGTATLSETLRDTFIAFVIASRRRFIPYRLRATIRYLTNHFRDYDLIDRLLGVGVVIFGAIIWTSFLVLQKGQRIIHPKKTEG